MAGPAPRLRPPLAIATLIDVPRRASIEPVVCGLTKWCLNARALVRLLGSTVAEVLVLTNNVSLVEQECAHIGAQLRVLEFDAAFAQTIQRYRASALHNVSGSVLCSKSHSTFANLRKWQYVSMTEYAVIFSSDFDVDFFFNASAMALHAANWPLHLHRFRHSRLQLLATGCFESPFNGGNFLLKPSRRLYDIGVEVLETGRFNLSHGFNFSGRPRALIHPLNAVRFRIARSIRKDTWDFAGGNTDQGLFTYIYLMREPGTSNPASKRGIYDVSMHCPFVHKGCTVAAELACPMPVTHFWGTAKPWLLEGVRTFSCPEYFDGFSHLNASIDEPGQTGLMDVAVNATATARDIHVVQTPCASWLRQRRKNAQRRTRAAGGRIAVHCGAVAQCIW